MKKGFIKWGLVSAGMLLLIAGTILGGSVIEKLTDSYGINSTGKVVVSLAKNADKTDSMLSVDDIDELREQPGTQELAAAAYDKQPVEYASRSVTSDIRGVSFNYPGFQTLNIIKGSFLSRADEEETTRAAVVDEELALELFNTTDVIGNEVDLYGESFQIIGVIQKDQTILGLLSDQPEPIIYIPANVLLELEPAAGISSIQVKTGKTDLLGRNEDIVSEALSAVGKNPLNYVIEDYGTMEYMLRQQLRLLVFVPGLALMLTLAALVIKKTRKLLTVIASECKADYFMNVVKMHRQYILREVTRLAVMAAGIAASWLAVSFDIYIPQSYIPGELIDLSFYIDLIRDCILQNNDKIGYMPPPESLVLIKAQLLTDWLFYLALFAGISMVILGLYLLKLKQTSLSVLAPACGIITAAAAATAVLAAIAAGLPVIIDTKGILILFAFVFIYSILFSKERDEVFQC